MSHYKFPKDTCELSNKVLKQPYSAFVNLVSIIVLVLFLLFSRNFYISCIFISLIFFEIIHCYSHMKHLDSNRQALLIHLISYITLISIAFVFYKKSSYRPHLYLVLLWIVLFFIDLGLFIAKISNLYTIILTSIEFLLLFIMYSKLFFTTTTKPWMITVITFACLIILALINEAIFCNQLMSIKKLPYHIIVELFGLGFFTSLGFLLLKI
jgi:hypothetical protein